MRELLLSTALLLTGCVSFRVRPPMEYLAQPSLYPAVGDGLVSHCDAHDSRKASPKSRRPCLVVTKPNALRERELGAESLSDGGVIVSHTVADPRWMVAHVLQYEPGAEVLEPSEVPEMVAAGVERIARQL